MADGVPEGCVLELESVMLGEDFLVRRTVIWHVWVMVLAEDVRRPFEGMVADPPTALRMAVHLAHTGIDTHTYSADQGCFSEIGAET